MSAAPALIPVTLEFIGVTRDSNLSVALTTDGAEWSMGNIGGDALGFSYNAQDLGNSRPSNIHSVELTESMLNIRMGTTASAGPFTFNLFLRAPENIESVRGTCTMNSEAKVYATFGYQGPIEWRSGPIRALLPKAQDDFCHVRLLIRGAMPGQSVRIGLETDPSQGGTARWSFGPTSVDTAAFTMRMSDGTSVALNDLKITKNHVTFRCGPPSAGTLRDLLLDLCVQRLPCANGQALNYFELSAECGQGVTVLAQVDTQNFQPVTNTAKLFQFRS